jgi:hypothetical protein
LGNVLELCHVFDPRHYRKEVPNLVVAERTHVYETFKGFKADFCKHYQLSMSGEMKDPQEALFDPSLLHLSVTLHHYKKRMHDYDNKFSPERFSTAIRRFLELRHPVLLEAFDKDTAPGTRVQNLPYTLTFNWTGPSFILVPTSEGLLAPEPRQSGLSCSSLPGLSSFLVKRTSRAAMHRPADRQTCRTIPQ